MKKEKNTKTADDLRAAYSKLEAEVADKLQKSLKAYEEYVKARAVAASMKKEHSKIFANLRAAKYRAENPEKHIFYGKRRTQEMQPGYLRTKLKQMGVSHEETAKHPELLNIMREHLVAYRNRDASWNSIERRELLLSKIYEVQSKKP